MQYFAAFRRFPLPFLILVVLTLSLIAIGCGDGHTTIASTPVQPSPTPSPSPSPSPSPAAASVVQVRVGDAPVDQIMDFEVTLVSPIVATLSSGQTLNVEIPGNRIDLSHMVGKFEPIMNLTLPQGSYTGIQITIADPAITYVYTAVPDTDLVADAKHQLVSQDFPGNQTVTVTFDPPLVIGADPTVLNLDVNIASTLVFNPEDSQSITGVQFTPATFAIIQKPIAAPELQQHQDGELECAIGTVTAISGNIFFLRTGQSGAQLAINATSSTVFQDGLTGVPDVLGRVIEVDGYTASDGTLVASEVELFAATDGAGVQGIVLDAGSSLDDLNLLSFPHQPNSFSMLVQDSTGNGAVNGDLGWTFTVKTQDLPAEAYEVDFGKTDWQGLEVPGRLFPFDAQHIFPGQRVEVSTGLALPEADLMDFTATGVELAQQAVTGEILFYHAPDTTQTTLFGPPLDTGTWFMLALPKDSFVRALSGRSKVMVYQGPGTDLEFLSGNTDKQIGPGSVVRVRGLMFMPFDNPLPDAVTVVTGNGPFLSMIARRIIEQGATEQLPTTTR